MHQQAKQAWAERMARNARERESAKRAEAARARAAASRASGRAVAAQRTREAERREAEARSAARDANAWQARAASYQAGVLALQERLRAAEEAERRIAERRAAADRGELVARLETTEQRMEWVVRELRAPRPEQLRLLMLAASAEGDLRVGREASRIRAAVERAAHRDLVEIDLRPSATVGDLLDGITRFRPHVVHFSGHSDDDLVVFEQDVNAPHKGVIVSAGAFARALTASDDPPLLVVLNSCGSAGQIEALVRDVAPFAIGMSASIGDEDAIEYAAQFYAAVANGQSLRSAHASGRSAIELAGLPGHELPTLAHRPDVGPGTTFLVVPPE